MAFSLVLPVAANLPAAQVQWRSGEFGKAVPRLEISGFRSELRGDRDRANPKFFA